MFTKRLPLNEAITALLGVLTLAVLAFNLPEPVALVRNGGILVFYGVLAALVLNFGRVIAETDFTPGHGIGMLALLSLPPSAFRASLWILTLASALGQLVFSLRRNQRASSVEIIMVSIRMALSFYAAGLAYRGELPLTDLTGETFAPVLVYGIVYSVIYFLLYLLEGLMAGKPLQPLRDYAPGLALMLALPILFAALGAILLNQLSALAFAVYLIGFGLILVYQHGIMHDQRLQLEQLTSSTHSQIDRDEQERVSQLATLNRILTLLTDTLSPETVMDTIISSASTVADGSAVAVYSFRDEYLGLARSAGLSYQFQAHPPTPLVAGKAHDFSHPVIVRDASLDAPALREEMEREGKAAWIELPLTFQTVPVGVLVVYYDEPRDFSADHVEMLRTFASQCAQAISNARLYEITDEALEQRVGQLLALANIGHHLTATLEVRAICDLVVEYTLQSTEANAAILLLLNGAGEVEQRAASGFPPTVFDLHQRPASGTTAKAIRTRSAATLGDVRTDPNASPLLPDTRAQLSTPILWNEAVVGVITLESELVNAFSEEDSYFVQQLANQAIIAIENARLFRKVAESRDRMQVILNTVKEGLILISTTGEVVLANPRVDLMGMAPEELIGRSLEQLLDDLNLAERVGFRTGSELQRLVKELRAPGGLAAREPKVFTVEGDEPRYIERQVFPVYDEAEQPLGVLLVFYDETEEMKLAKTREEVSQMLIHDLRSPLTSVTTSLKLLTDLTPKDSTFRPIIETTTDASRRAIRKLLNRVDSLLDVARMENGSIAVETKPTELATLVDNVCVELSPLAQELEVVIKPEISADLPLLDIDADKVERLLLNLVDNALKFSPANSVVSICTHEPGAEGAAPGFVRIDVIDDGPGVPDEYKLILFDRFVQVRGRTGARRGTGLGLTFCRLVAETHGGHIWIDDNPTGGSIFAVTLPVAVETGTGDHSD